MVEVLLILLGLLALCFATRLLWASELGSDFYTQFFLQRAYRTTGSLSLSHLPNAIFQKSETFYPAFPAFIYAKLPERYVIGFGIILNYLCDYALAIAIFFYARTQGNSINAGLLAALWLSLPILHPINARLTGLGARTIGTLLVSLFFLGLLFYSIHDIYVGLILSFVSAVLVILSSQFGLQALVFLSTGLSIGMWSICPVLLVASGLLICFLWPGLGIRRKLYLKKSHLCWYLQMRQLFLGERNNLSKCARFVSEKRLFRLLVYLISSTTPGIVLVGLSGLIFVFVSFYFLGGASLTPEPSARFLISLAVTGLFVTLLTMTGPLSVLGEAERYIEYVSPFVVLLLAASYSEQPLFREALLFGILCCLVFVMVNYIVHTKMFEIKEAFALSVNMKDNAGLFEYLEKFGKRRIATSPISLASELSLAAPAGHVFLFNLLFDETSEDFHWPSPPAVYPYLDLRASSLEKFAIDTVVLLKNHIDKMLGPNHPKELSGWRKLVADPYVVYLKE